jgi:hypothetical protein
VEVRKLKLGLRTSIHHPPSRRRMPAWDAALNHLRLEKQFLAAIAAACLATAYLCYTLLGWGTEFRSGQERRNSYEAAARHDAVCANLGISRADIRHAACMDELDSLRGWHQKAFIEENTSPL